MSINNPRNPLSSISSNSSAPLEEIYSTEETRIGTWIDGKPLYRIVVTGVFPDMGTSWTTIYQVRLELITLCRLSRHIAVHLHTSLEMDVGSAHNGPISMDFVRLWE